LKKGGKKTRKEAQKAVSYYGRKRKGFYAHGKGRRGKDLRGARGKRRESYPGLVTFYERVPCLPLRKEEWLSRGH